MRCDILEAFADFAAQCPCKLLCLSHVHGWTAKRDLPGWFCLEVCTIFKLGFRCVKQSAGRASERIVFLTAWWNSTLAASAIKFCIEVNALAIQQRLIASLWRNMVSSRSFDCVSMETISRHMFLIEWLSDPSVNSNDRCFPLLLIASGKAHGTHGTLW